MSRYNDDFFFNLAENHFLEPEPDLPEEGRCSKCGWPVYKDQLFEYIDGELIHSDCKLSDKK